MSHENVELAKRLNAMLAAGDINGAQALLADDLVVGELHAPLDEPSVFYGREAVLGHWAATIEVFDDSHREINEWLDVGDWVVTVGRWKTGRAEVDGHAIDAERWQDGKLVRLLLGFGSKTKALKAAGRVE
jgi:ketosteroid isomerase-like protein